MSNRPRPKQGLGQLAASAGVDIDGLEQRAKQSNLTFAATAFAMRGGCDCKACLYLRQAVDVLLANADTMVGIDAQGNHPQS